MSSDKWGNPLSNSSESVARGLDHAIELLAAYQADPIAAIDAVLAEQPDFVMGHAFKAGILATAADKMFEPELRKSVEAAEALLAQANDRERGHVAASRAWLNGDFDRATERWGRVAIDHPRDLAAVQFAHLGDFYHGFSHMLRDRVARVLPQWHRGVPGYGFVLGMYAFGLEESGDYAQAEAIGREAVGLNGQDGWAVHAVAHVLEMQGRADEGVKFLGSSADVWAPNSTFSFHNFWHQALFAIDSGDVPSALKLYDEKISAGGFGQALELVDGSALLWRLTLLGHDVGSRWTLLADKWAERLEDGYYAFNDVHAMMSFVGAGRREEQIKLIQVGKGVVRGDVTNAIMTCDVGLPAMRGLEAFGRGQYAEAIDYLMPVRAKANRFGGSHAQRDVFSWTLTEAAIRSGDRALAEALVAERMSWKPDSPVNQTWAARARALSSKKAA